MPDKSYGTSDNALHILLQAPVPVLPYRSVLQLPLLHRGPEIVIIMYEQMQG